MTIGIVTSGPGSMARSRLLPAVVFLAFGMAGCRESAGPGDRSVLVIAHRGASFHAPEHTTAAYDLALAQGADYLELDVGRSADGALVVVHDATLDRTFRGAVASCAGSLAEKTIAQLRTCDTGSWFNSANPARARAEYSSLRILTLSEVIDRYPSARLAIEIKNPELYAGIEAQLLATLASHLSVSRNSDPPRFVIQSFYASSLQALRALDPGLPLVFLVNSPDLPQISASMGQIASYATAIGIPWVETTPALVQAARTAGLDVFSWVLNEAAPVLGLAAAGARGIVTDRPDVIIEALRSLD